MNKKQLSKIGLGTWGIGGFMDADPNNDDQKQIDAMAHTLNKGVNYIETVFMYARGKAIDLLSQAVEKSGVDREKLFIVFSVYQGDTASIEEAESRINDFLKKMGISYLDSIQFNMSFIQAVGFEPVEKLVNKLFAEKKARYTSLTNASLEFLKRYHQAFGDRLFGYEGVFNFEVRENESAGITAYLNEHNILNVIFQPLRRNSTAKRKWPLLVQLAKKYSKTQNQILLNWIVSKGYFPLVKSSEIAHIDENLASFDFEMSEEDLEKLNNFKIPNYVTPKIDWEGTGDGVKLHQLPNDWDAIYDKQLSAL